MLKITQGDAVTLALRAKTGVSTYFDLTSAVFVTTFKGVSLPVTVSDSSHTEDSDQGGNKGKFTLVISAAISSRFAVGSNQTFITKVTQGAAVMHFRGTIEVLSDRP